MRVELILVRKKIYVKKRYEELEFHDPSRQILV